ncbi:hypothetical protein FP2506_12874 [Fulvimarina pelagi HTCC2506]|uniref:DUF3429 domain-containing protein n=2 Tax=Fulvimarina pelagi TaxID=217511 RepID=Q0G1C1_9HYPH|nr:DUF3429 domain-containing protein [Fulvimarina pelagi]EAU41160.1 hypothetical protein FP2506_12874 [Fulvimarina pelagi HTCC2506]BAT30826.1 hypothetical protein [Fulvimarina pelagi]
MTQSDSDNRRIVTEEPADIPADGLFFAYLAMLPIVAGAVGLFVLPDNWAFLTLNFTLLWGAAILTFLSGVRRGVSFRQPGGPKATQIAMMLLLFVTGFAAILSVVWAFPLYAVGLELIGYVALAVLDPISAKKGRAPLYFAKLRPVQMLLPILSLAVVGYWVSTSPFF